MLKLLLILFIAVPILEIYLLLEVGGIIGVIPTIGIVIATAILGAALLKHQGISTAARLQTELSSGTIPAITMVEGVCLLVAGALLLTPGFATDAVGFALLIPPSRRALATWIVEQAKRQALDNVAKRSQGGTPNASADLGADLSAGRGQAPPGPNSRRQSNTIEGEFKSMD